MLCVGGLLRCGLSRLRPPAPAVCSAVMHRKSPACSAPGQRSGVRGVSGATGDATATAPPPGWYGGLLDSAPVHLCEELLVGVQQASGLPWWLSIAVATLSVRTVVTLPLAAYQLVIYSRVSFLAPTACG